MLPVAFMICGLATAPPAKVPVAELVERLKNRHFDDTMVGYEEVVIARLEAKLAWAKKTGRPQAEIDDIENALASWRKTLSPGYWNQGDGQPIQPTNPFSRTPPSQPKESELPVPQPPPRQSTGNEGIALLQLLIAQAASRGDQSTAERYQKMLDELREKQRKR